MALRRSTTALRRVAMVLWGTATVWCGVVSSLRASEILLLQAARGLGKIGTSSRGLNLS